MNRVLVGVIGVAGCVGALAGCTTNAATGKSQFNSLSRSQEVAIGAEAQPQLTAQYGGEVEDAYLRSYVTGLGLRLVSETERAGKYAELPWEFTILNSGVINAFALPGGKVFVSRALIEEMENEAQLAGVLGHEIGHVTAEHADQQVTRQMILAIGAAAASIAAGQSENDAVRYGVPVLVSSAGMFNLRFGRNEELEADRLGVRYMTRAKYNPIGQVQVMEILRKAAAGGAQPEWLSTHPAPSTRVRKLEKLIAEKYADTQNNPAYVLNEQSFQANVLPRFSRMAPPRADAAWAVPAGAIACRCGAEH